jgi:hypothetical protein
MKLGFTGTRRGLTAAQEVTLRKLIEEWNPREFHFGCCVGADAEAAQLVNDLTMAVLYGYPSNIPAMTADKAVDLCDDLGEPKPPLDRNHDIVAACDMLLACPEGTQEERRSGTWHTVRGARKARKPVLIVWPDGTALLEANK